MPNTIDIVHVVPLNDILVHRVTTEDGTRWQEGGVCDCCPRVIESDTLKTMVVHNRFSMQVDENGDVFVNPMLN